SVENTAPRPAANVFLTSSGTRRSRRWRMVSGSSSCSSPAAPAAPAARSLTTGRPVLRAWSSSPPLPRGTPYPRFAQTGILERMAEPAAHGEKSASRDAVRAPPGVVGPAVEEPAIAIASEPRRYREVKDSRPPPLRIRSWRAYWVTFLVIGSYLVLRLRARL